MKSNDQTDDLRFDRLYLFEKFQFAKLGDRYALLRICHQHFLDHFNRLDADITWKHIKPFNDFLVEFLGCLLFKGQRPTDHPVENDAK